LSCAYRADWCCYSVGNYITEPAEFHQYASELFELVRSGKLDIAVHAEYPLTTEGIRQTQLDITGRGTSGKLVVKVAV
jgi:NADPH2:quinone reductase